MESLMSKQSWAARLTKHAYINYQSYKHYAHHIFIDKLPRNKDFEFIEVGCVPGRNMVYFANNFSYKVYGIDYCDIGDVKNNLKASNIQYYEVINADFITMDKSHKYNVVFSDGFVEHFLDAEAIFKMHCEILQSGGYLIVSVPNMRYLQKILRILIGVKRVFKWHNLDVMFPDIWRSMAVNEGLSVLYCDYVNTFDLWLPPDTNRLLRYIVRGTVKLITTFLELCRLNNIPNRFLSPAITLVARKHDINPNYQNSLSSDR